MGQPRDTTTKCPGQNVPDKMSPDKMPLNIKTVGPHIDGLMKTNALLYGSRRNRCLWL